MVTAGTRIRSFSGEVESDVVETAYYVLVMRSHLGYIELISHRYDTNVCLSLLHIYGHQRYHL